MEEKFENLAPSGQILDPHALFGAPPFQISTHLGFGGWWLARQLLHVLNPYHKVLLQLHEDLWTTKRARDNGFADHIGEARLPLSFGLANAIKFGSGWNLRKEASNYLIDVVHT